MLFTDYFDKDAELAPDRDMTDDADHGLRPKGRGVDPL